MRASTPSRPPCWSMEGSLTLWVGSPRFAIPVGGRQLPSALCRSSSPGHMQHT